MRGYLKILKFVLFMLTAGIVFYLGYKYGSKHSPPSNITTVNNRKDTIVLYRTDTIIKKIPIYKTTTQRDTIVVYLPEGKTKWVIDTTLQNVYFDSVLVVIDTIKISCEISEGKLNLTRSQGILWRVSQTRLTIEAENINRISFHPKSISELLSINIVSASSPYWIGGGVVYNGKFAPIIIANYKTRKFIFSAIAGYNLIGASISLNLH